jgi:hypothetical protein
VDPALVRPTLDGQPSRTSSSASPTRAEHYSRGSTCSQSAAVAANGEKVTSQTRRRISEADAVSGGSERAQRGFGRLAASPGLRGLFGRRLEHHAREKPLDRIGCDRRTGR